MSDVMLWQGIPEPIFRSDNDPEFLARDLRQWLWKLGIGTLSIEPGSPWENGYCERFHGKLRDECLKGDIFYSLKESQIVMEPWREEDNTRRPYSVLNDGPPAPRAAIHSFPPNRFHSLRLSCKLFPKEWYKNSVWSPHSTKARGIT